MYESILVPLDGSPRSELILAHIEALALEFGSKVILLCVIEPDQSLLSPQDAHAGVNIELLRAKRAEIEGYLAGLRGIFRSKGIETQTVVELGPVVDTIIRIADQEAVDLIAMASHGRSGLERVFYGSVAAGVLQRVDRPLLLVRARRL
ncbi:MAG: universal stress protein [Anaerolineales bacterium]|nr:MAG: universal stress protein [Anaerolineales bacterium]